MDEVVRICTWLQQLETFKRPLVPVQTHFMSPTAIAAVERAADAFNSTMRRRAAAAASGAASAVTPATGGAAIVAAAAAATPVPSQALRCPGVLPEDVFKPESTSSYAVGGVGEGHGTALGVNNVDGPSCVPLLGDRIANLSYRQAPLGLRGTVVAVHPASGFVEVVFDAEFVGGGSLGGLCTVGRGALVPWSAVLCLSRSPGDVPLLSQVDVATAAVHDGGPSHSDSGMPRGRRGIAHSSGPIDGSPRVASNTVAPSQATGSPHSSKIASENQRHTKPGAPYVSSATQSLDAVAAQINFYLSPTNLVHDAFLSSHITAEGWVSLALLSTFKRMKELASGNVATLCAAISTHGLDLELSEDKLCVRRKRAPETVKGAGTRAHPHPNANSLAPSVASLFAAATPAASPPQPVVQSSDPSSPSLNSASTGRGGGAASYWQTLMQAAPLSSTEVFPDRSDPASVVTGPTEHATSAPEDGSRPHFSALLEALAGGPVSSSRNTGPPRSAGSAVPSLLAPSQMRK
jgi:hypothetical protein